MITWQAFVLALIMQESGGNNLAVGDGGDSHGPLQIQAACVADANLWRKARGLSQYKFPEDCYDRAKAEQILIAYIGRYATEERLGRKPTCQDYARIWNGGPNGYRNRVDKDGNLTEATKNTIKYWEKLKKNNPSLR